MPHLCSLNCLKAVAKTGPFILCMLELTRDGEREQRYFDVIDFYEYSCGGIRGKSDSQS